MLLHYYAHHKRNDKNANKLLQRSKGGFDIRISENCNHKNIEENPKVVNLDPELQAIIDYKDSMIDASQLKESQSQINEKMMILLKQRTTHKRVSTRFCGNLMSTHNDKRQLSDDIERNNQFSNKLDRDTQSSQKSRLISGSVFANLNQKDDEPTDSDPATDLQLSKRDGIDEPALEKQYTPTDKLERPANVELGRSSDKRVSRRCSNLA